MKEYYVTFVIKGIFNNDFQGCFISTDKKLTEKRLGDFYEKIANEININKDNIVILGITKLDDGEE